MMAHNILTANAIHWKFPTHSITTMDNEITVFEPGPIPTQSEIDGYIVEYEAHLKSIEYRKKRKKEYPSIDDVTIALAEKAEGDSTMWDEITEKRQAVKTKYPKG